MNKRLRKCEVVIMKKNLVPLKKMDFYKHYFLPMIEVILTVKKIKSQDLVLNKSSLAEYFDIDRRDVADYLQQAEVDGLIKFDKKVRKFDDKKLDFAISKYLLPEASKDSTYYSKLQEFINSYMLWIPNFGDRLDFYYDYVCSVEKAEVNKSIRQLEKEERAKKYAEVYYWTIPMTNEINKNRPEKLKSRYLADGNLRESNFLCATLNPEKDHDAKIFATDLTYRYIVLEEFFGTSDFIECDTNASIYRLSYNLAHNKLLDDNIDIYQEFWRLAGFSGTLDRVSRDSLKLLCMTIFMSNGSTIPYNVHLLAEDDKKLTKSELQRKDILKYMSKKTNLPVRQFLDRLTDAMYKFIEVDEFLEEEIFIHESNLHLIILSLCEERNIKAINVYDGFYFKKSDMTDAKYNDLYREATALLKKYEKSGVVI